MSTTREDLEVLLTAPTPTEAEMAKDLLAEAGIPSRLQGSDRVLAALGYAVESVQPRPDLYVSRGSKARALSILKDAWSEQALTESRPSELWEDAEAARIEDKQLVLESRRSTKGLFVWIALLICVAVLVATLVRDQLSSRG